MIQIVLTLCTLYQLSIARRLLQFAPNDHIQPVPHMPNLPVIVPLPIPNLAAQTNAPQPVLVGIGYYDQQCVEPEPYFICNAPGVSIQGPIIECAVEYSCCMCQSIKCGTKTKRCDGFTVGANYGVYGVQDISILGLIDRATLITCGASFACSQTRIVAENVNVIECMADNSCSDTVMELTNSRGLNCNAQKACFGATFIMTNNNGGEIKCIAGEACHGAVIITQNIHNVRCDGRESCKNANIKISAPVDHFSLICNDNLSCENLKLELTIPAPSGGCHVVPNGQSPENIPWFGITCSSPSSCKGLEFTVINNGCNPIIMEQLECEAPDSCIGAIFNLNAGIGQFAQMVDIQHCKCGVSCQMATGIDTCYDNMRVVSCAAAKECMNQRGYVTNPANGFQLLCPREYSCAGLGLGVVISGGSNNLIRTMKGIDCRGSNGCKGAIIMFTNTQKDHNENIVSILIDTITCSHIDSCKDTTFITGPNVIIQQFVCDETFGDSCSGCIIKIYPADVGRPCRPVQISPIPVLPNPTEPAPANQVEPTQETPSQPVLPVVAIPAEPTQETQPQTAVFI